MTLGYPSVLKTNLAVLIFSVFIFLTNSAKAQSSLPLTLLHFDVTLKSEIVHLNWTTTEHRSFSHFNLQRSADGRNFKDVATILTDVADFNTVHQYNYNDDFTGSKESIVYYRLQMVDVNSNFDYSPIRMVRFNVKNTVQIQTFPNPVASELRVLIPTTWQEKTVAYEVYTANGVLVSRVKSSKAAQIQQINVSSLGSGNYIIRVSNGQEISTSKFIKN